MIRRRSYNYTDGLDANGQLNAGLLFVSYQNDPQAFHSSAEPARRPRPAQRIHPPHRISDLRGAARARRRPLHRAGAVQLSKSRPRAQSFGGRKGRPGPMQQDQWPPTEDQWLSGADP